MQDALLITKSSIKLFHSKSPSFLHYSNQTTRNSLTHFKEAIQTTTKSLQSTKPSSVIPTKPTSKQPNLHLIPSFSNTNSIESLSSNSPSNNIASLLKGTKSFKKYLIGKQEQLLKDSKPKMRTHALTSAKSCLRLYRNQEYYDNIRNMYQGKEDLGKLRRRIMMMMMNEGENYAKSPCPAVGVKRNHRQSEEEGMQSGSILSFDSINEGRGRIWSCNSCSGKMRKTMIEQKIVMSRRGIASERSSGYDDNGDRDHDHGHDGYGSDRRKLFSGNLNKKIGSILMTGNPFINLKKNVYLYKKKNTKSALFNMGLNAIADHYVNHN